MTAAEVHTTNNQVLSDVSLCYPLLLYNNILTVYAVNCVALEIRV